MEKINLVGVLALVSALGNTPSSSQACINDYVPNAKAVGESRSVAHDLVTVELAEPWTERRDRLRKQVSEGGDYQARNDFASALMHTGDPMTAIQILEEIEREKPGLYQTASTLGTAYELAGNNAKALKWIRIGIERNPHSHEGSEWLHVRILEAKIHEPELATKSDPNWTNTGSLLGLTYQGSELRTQLLGNNGELLSVEEIKRGLKYQLHERLQFVHPKNQIVASLLFDLGTIIEHEPSPGMAQGIYELAQQYAETSTLDQEHVLRAIFEPAVRRTSKANRSYNYLNPPVLGGIAILFVIAIYGVGKLRERSKRRQLIPE